MFCNTWLAIGLYDGKNDVVKCMLCNSDKNPLLFETQLTALNFWKEHREKFEIDQRYLDKRVRATPKVVRDTDDPDDVLFDMIENGERLPIIPKPGHMFYSDIENPAEYLGTVAVFFRIIFSACNPFSPLVSANNFGEFLMNLNDIGYIQEL